MANSRDIRIRNRESDNTRKQQNDDGNRRSHLEFGVRIVVDEKVAKNLFYNAMKGIDNDTMKGAPYAEDIEDVIKKFRDMDSIGGLPIQGDKQEMIDALSSLAGIMKASDEDAADNEKRFADKPEFNTVYKEVIAAAQANERVRYALKELHIPSIEDIQVKITKGTDITYDMWKKLDYIAIGAIKSNRDANYWQKFKYANNILDAVRRNTPIELDTFLSEAAFLVDTANTNEGKAHMEALKRGILNAIEPMTEKRLLGGFLPNDLPKRTKTRAANAKPLYESSVFRIDQNQPNSNT